MMNEEIERTIVDDSIHFELINLENLKTGRHDVNGDRKLFQMGRVESRV